MQDTEKIRALQEVIKNPAKIKSLDLVAYQQELQSTKQEHMIDLINYIIQEFEQPFADSRLFRTFKTAMI